MLKNIFTLFTDKIEYKHRSSHISYIFKTVKKLFTLCTNRIYYLKNAYI